MTPEFLKYLEAIEKRKDVGKIVDVCDCFDLNGRRTSFCVFCTGKKTYLIIYKQK